MLVIHRLLAAVGALMLAVLLFQLPAEATGPITCGRDCPKNSVEKCKQRCEATFEKCMQRAKTDRDRDECFRDMVPCLRDCER